MRVSNDMRKGVVHKTLKSGELTILCYHSCSRVDVEFSDTGFKTTAEASDIRRGHVKDLLFRNIFGVGFFGVGNFRTKGDTDGRAYSAWYNMMLRCYSESKPSRYKTYDDCSVCDHWHNYQHFAQWYVDHYPCDGNSYELDKDLLSVGSKVYSPDTCLFISGFDNKRIAREVGYSLVSPDGVVFEGVNISRFSKEQGLSHGHVSSVMSGKRKHHKGWVKNEQ